MPMLPSRRFDHAIVRASIEGQEMWFDPAGGPFGFGDIPLNDQGVRKALIARWRPRADGRYPERSS